ncbi:MAG: radical SAM protein [Nanoarchaeota archaeon]
MKLIKIIDKKCNPLEEPNNFIEIGKALFSIENDFIETLFMIKKDKSMYFCISSQLGCPIGCKFCINDSTNFNGNLSCKEILSQIYLILSKLKINLDDLPFIGVMFSGCGEPSLNSENVINSIKELNKIKNCKVSITTTIASIEGIKRIIEAKINFGLQISLHGYSDKIRKRLIPSSEGLKKIFEMCDKYYQKRQKIIDLNYLVTKIKMTPFLKYIDSFQN